LLIGHLVKSDSQDRGLKSEGRKGNALDKHVVLFVNEKYYVPSYKLLRLIIELRGNWIKIRNVPMEESRTHI
jgi:hypothetical protein